MLGLPGFASAGKSRGGGQDMPQASRTPVHMQSHKFLAHLLGFRFLYVFAMKSLEEWRPPTKQDIFLGTSQNRCHFGRCARLRCKECPKGSCRQLDLFGGLLQPSQTSLILFLCVQCKCSQQWAHIIQVHAPMRNEETEERNGDLRPFEISCLCHMDDWMMGEF